MAIDKELRLKITQEAEGKAIQELTNDVQVLEKNLLNIRKANLQLKKDYGSTSQEFVNGKKQELTAISELTAKKKALQQTEKSYADTSKRLSAEIKETQKRNDQEASEHKKRLLRESSEEEKRIQRQRLEAFQLEKAKQKELSDYNKSLRAQEIAGQRQSQIFKGQSTTLGSIDAIKQQVAHYKQLQSSLSATDPRLESVTARIRQLSQTQRELSGTTRTSIHQFLEFGENLTVVMAGVGALYSQLKNTAGDFINEANKLRSATLGLESIAEFKGVSRQSAVESIKNLDLVKNGLLTVSEASLTLKNLLATGFGLEDSIELMKAFGDTAAFGRQGSLDFGQAIVSGSEGLKNQNSILLDNIGLTKNISNIVKEAGYSMGTWNEIGKDANYTQAIFNGLMKEMQPNIGNAEKLTKEFAGQQAQLEANTKVLKQEFGEFIQSALLPIIKYVNEGSDTTKVLAGSFITLGGTMSSLLPIILSLKIAFPSMLTRVGTAIKSFRVLALGEFGLVLLALYELKELVDYINDNAREIEQRAPSGDVAPSDTLGGEDASVDNYIKKREKDKAKEETKKEEQTKKKKEETGTSISEKEESIKKLKEEINNIDEKNTDLAKQKTAELKAQEKALEKQKKKFGLSSDKGTGKKPRDKKEDNVLTEIEKKQEELLSIEKERDKLQTQGLQTSRAYVDVLERIRDLVNEIDLLSSPDLLTGKLPNLETLQKSVEIIKNISIGGIAKEQEPQRSTAERIAPDEQKTRNVKKDVDDIVNSISSVMSVLGIGTDNFVSKIIAGFNVVLTIMEAIKTVNSILGIIPGLASGGVVSAGGLYRVGEKGEELFVPKVDGRILSHYDSLKLKQNIPALSRSDSGNIIQNIIQNPTQAPAQIIHVPMIAGFRRDGRDIKVVVNLANKLENERLL